MSGLEVAGVVLGAIPLLIAGLEHYAEGASTVKRIFHAPREFRSLGRRLRVEHDIFRNALELLLTDCVDDTSIQDLLDDVGGSRWSEPEIDAALRSKLQNSYPVYLETVQDMNKTLLALRARLRIGDDGKGPFDHDQTSFREAWKRFKFGIRQSDYMDLINEITRDNNSVHKLTEINLALEPARTTRKKIPNFNKVRDYATSMFRTLQTGLRGSCQASHTASLYMKPLELGLDRLNGAEENAFRIVLHHNLQSPSLHSPQWTIEEAEVRMLDALVASASGRTAITGSVPSLPVVKRAVRWKDPVPVGLAPGGGSNIATSASSQQALNEIKDLCESIQKSRMSKCGMCLGYLLDQVGARRHALYWPEEPLVARNTLSSVSLESLLKGDGTARSKQPKLSVAESRRLALALSLGVLRLHDTPWLSHRWGRKDITLFEQNGTVLAKHPFVSANFQQATQDCAQKSSPAIRNETLFALGVVLIELCMGDSFDSMFLPEDLSPDGSKHAASDFLAANRLVDRVYDQAGKRYGDAVRRCILCEFDQRKSSLKDDAFRRAVYDNVVAVLEEDVAQFFGH